MKNLPCGLFQEYLLSTFAGDTITQSFTVFHKNYFHYFMLNQQLTLQWFLNLLHRWKTMTKLLSNVFVERKYFPKVLTLQVTNTRITIKLGITPFSFKKDNNLLRKGNQFYIPILVHWIVEFLKSYSRNPFIWSEQFPFVKKRLRMGICLCQYCPKIPSLVRSFRVMWWEKISAQFIVLKFLDKFNQLKKKKKKLRSQWSPNLSSKKPFSVQSWFRQKPKMSTKYIWKKSCTVFRLKMIQKTLKSQLQSNEDDCYGIL